MTAAAVEMIREWLKDSDSEAVAKYMSQTLRIGGMKACRAMVRAAVEAL